MKVALVYDRVNKIGGAEKVLQTLHEIWPDAPLFTSVYSKKNASWAKDFRVIPSFLQHIPFAKKAHEFFPGLTPMAFESFNLKSFDVVISVTSAEAKSVITTPKQIHICYCLTPTRYLWSGYWDYLQNPGFNLLNPIAKAVFWLNAPKMRIRDFVSAQRPDFYLAISKAVQKRIKKYYRRESIIIHPPINISAISNQQSAILRLRSGRVSKKPSYFLVVSRLVPYKRIDLIVKTFNQMGLKLKIAGAGSQLSFLQKIAKRNIEFLGNISDNSLSDLYFNSQALIMAADEDFGITALEAQAAGRPVIALKKGGALDTIIEGKTGLFFKSQTTSDLKLAINKFKRLKFKPLDCKSNAEKFSKSIFIKKFKKFTEDKWKQKQIQK